MIVGGRVTGILCLRRFYTQLDALGVMAWRRVVSLCPHYPQAGMNPGRCWQVCGEKAA